MRVTVIGTGYVGLTTGVALAYLGHQVVGVDKDPGKLEILAQGGTPIHEPGLEELFALVREDMTFTADTSAVVGESELILIAVGTPAKQNGEADTRYVEEAAQEVAAGLLPGRTYTLVVKSTVPIGSNHRVAHVVNRELEARGVAASVHMASNPEFLREGHAVHDTLYPDRIVVGTEAPAAEDTLRRLYAPILEQRFTPPDPLPRPEDYNGPAFIITDATSAEMIKYASNAFLAVKISFTNEIAGLCERVGADVQQVAQGMGLDSRIGPKFLGAGLGWGGSCFPKDTQALAAVGGEYGYAMPIVEAAQTVNRRQRQVAIEKLQAALKILRGRTIGVLGLAFKPHTDDVRDAPAIDIIRYLTERGAHVRAHDPIAAPNARKALADVDLDFVDDPYEVAKDSHAVVLATEWDVYKHLDLGRLAAAMRQPVLLDGRNLYDPAKAVAAGFTYMGMGRHPYDVGASGAAFAEAAAARETTPG